MTPDARVQELLPCPFCGVAPVLARADNDPEWWVVECRNVRCSMDVAHEDIGRDAALEAWNQRAPTLDTRLAASAIAKLSDASAETERLRSALRELRSEPRWYIEHRGGCSREFGDAHCNCGRDALLTTIDSLLTPTRDPR